jgi:hypothetical protein
MRHETKTVAQLEAEVAYWRTQLARTSSRDRQRRAQSAIAARQAALELARARESRTSSEERSYRQDVWTYR